MREKIKQAVDSIKNELLDLSHNIHANPELGFEEAKAANWQVDLLRKHGFEVEMPYCNLKTAYKAVYGGSGTGPRIAFLAEYDALKGVGHACGHNIIAASAVGAAIGLSKVMDTLNGQVAVIGTPAEEGGGGKIIMVEADAFKHVDYAIMMHPSTKNLIGRGGLAAVSFFAEFWGKAAHSSSPEKGINALTSVISLFNGIDVLRQTWKDGAKISGIITAGGSASNVIPDYAAAKFTVRAKTRNYLLKMLEDLTRVANASASLTGAKVKTATDLLYAERYSNRVMGEAFKANMEALGEKMNYPAPNEPMGSSDIGNVSLEVPTIHEYLAIAPETVNAHSAEFCEAAVSPRGDEVVLLAAKGMAMTGADILADAALRERIYTEFNEKSLIAD